VRDKGRKGEGKRPVKLSGARKGARRKIHFSDYNRLVLDNASTSVAPKGTTNDESLVTVPGIPERNL